MSEKSVEISSSETGKVIEVKKETKDVTRDSDSAPKLDLKDLDTGALPSASGLSDFREEEEKRDLDERLKKTVQEARDKGEDLVHKPKDSVLGQKQQLKTDTLEDSVQTNAQQLVVTLKELDDVSMESPQDELSHIQIDMDRVLDRGFEPVRRVAERTGFWGKLKNRVKVGVRWAWAATFGALISAIGVAIKAPGKLLNEKSRTEHAQKERIHGNVPGRQGEQFGEYETEYDEEGKEQVYSDVRRGPLVWEKLTAGDPEQPPEVCIMVEQSQRGSGAALENMGMGHAMIGLSYSRYNKTTRRKERYRLQMGFYPKGGMVGTSATLAMTGGAFMPGQVKDDSGHHYDVARRYKVTPGQINAILRAAEHYEDKGYGYYKRNCSTFVVEMAREGGIELASHIEEDEMEFKGLTGLVVEAAEGMAAAGHYGAANSISSHMGHDDLNYQNFGQKMVTKDDLDRYYETALSADVVREGYSPGALGEIIRGSVEGEYDAYYEEDKALDPGQIGILMKNYGSMLWEEINQRIPLVKRIELDGQIREMLMLEDDKNLSVVTTQEGGPSAADLKGIHASISQRMKILNKYYRERLGQDAELNRLFMQYMSLCEAALSVCDSYYRKAVYNDAGGDVSYLKKAYTQLGFTATVKGSDNVEHTVVMAPGIYEGYLMAGRTPIQAVAEHEEFLELKRLDGDGGLSGRQESRYRYLSRVYTLAENFASANRYIMWKDADKLTDNDLKYAFIDLPEREKRKEKGETVGGDLIEKYGPSHTYQGIIFEKIFDGMKGIDELTSATMNLGVRVRVMDGYLMQKVNQSPDLMKKIIKCYNDNMPDEMPFAIATYIIFALYESYLLFSLAGHGIKKNTIENMVNELNATSGFRNFIINELNGLRGTE